MNDNRVEMEMTRKSACIIGRADPIPIADSHRDPGRAISDARKCFSYAARERYERS